MPSDVSLEQYEPDSVPTPLVDASAELLESEVWKSASKDEFFENVASLFRRHMVIARMNDEVVGVATVRIAKNAYLAEIAVSPDRRRKGIGGMVLSAMEDMARQRGAETMTCTVLEEAIPFYEDQGYAPAPEYPDEYMKHL